LVGIDETNLLSLVSSWLNNICQIQTKVLLFLFCKKSLELNKAQIQKNFARPNIDTLHWLGSLHLSALAGVDKGYRMMLSLAYLIDGPSHPSAPHAARFFHLPGPPSSHHAWMQGFFFFYLLPQIRNAARMIALRRRKCLRRPGPIDDKSGPLGVAPMAALTRLPAARVRPRPRPPAAWSLYRGRPVSPWPATSSAPPPAAAGHVPALAFMSCRCPLRPVRACVRACVCDLRNDPVMATRPRARLLINSSPAAGPRRQFSVWCTDIDRAGSVVY